MEHFSIINKVILAPMVRIGTLPFRRLCAKHGADIIFTEEIIDKKLISCKKIYNPDLKTNDYIYKDGSLALRIHEEEKNNLILQIGTSSPKSAVEAALLVKDDVIGIDVNMGCPKHFSTHGNMGSSLLALPDLVKEVL
jgi:tRNA-dihydrouridine synthase 2